MGEEAPLRVADHLDFRPDLGGRPERKCHEVPGIHPEERGIGIGIRRQHGGDRQHVPVAVADAHDPAAGLLEDMVVADHQPIGTQCPGGGDAAHVPIVAFTALVDAADEIHGIRRPIRCHGGEAQICGRTPGGRCLTGLPGKFIRGGVVARIGKFTELFPEPGSQGDIVDDLGRGARGDRQRGGNGKQQHLLHDLENGADPPSRSFRD